MQVPMIRRARQGFSIIEILIAIVVITIGVMGVLGSLAFGLQSTDNSERLSKAVQISRKIMEQALIDGPAGREVTPVPINANGLTGTSYNALFNVPGAGLSTQDFQNYTRQIEWFALAGPELVTNNPLGWESQVLQKCRVTVFFRDRYGVQKSVQCVGFSR